MRELLTATAERAIRYLEGLNGRGVAPDPAVVARLAELDIPLPTDPSPADETMALLDSYGCAGYLGHPFGKSDMWRTMEQSFLLKYVRYAYNQRGPFCAYALTTRLFS
jgi:hypothetical protein